MAWNTLGNRNFKKFHLSYWPIFYFEDFELRIGEQQDLFLDFEVRKSLDELARKSPDFEKVWAGFHFREEISAIP